MSAGLRYGFASAVRTIAGLQSALIIQLLVVAGGLGVLLETSALAFSIVKLCGAAYLIWLGIQAWRHASDTPAAVEPAQQQHGLSRRER